MDHLKAPLEQMAKRFFVVANVIRKGEHGPNTNVLISPFASSVIATMLYYAADGRTFHQLEHILSFKTLFDGEAQRKNILIAFREALKPCNLKSSLTSEKVLDFQLTIATRLFIQRGADIKAGFLDDVKKYLHIDWIEVDFSGPDGGRTEMSQWIEEVKGLLDFEDIPPVIIDHNYKYHRLATVSIAHFRAAWQVPFDRSHTTRQLFFPLTGAPMNVQMMMLTDKFPFYEDTEAGLKYIEIPYYKNSGSLILTLPTKKTLPEFVQTMTVKLMAGLRTRKKMKNVRITLPKYRVQCSYDLAKFFNLMDFGNGLDAEGRADLGHMTPDKDFRVNEGLLSCAIQVSESGSFVSSQPSAVSSTVQSQRNSVVAALIPTNAESTKRSSAEVKASFSRAMTKLVIAQKLKSGAAVEEPAPAEDTPVPVEPSPGPLYVAAPADADTHYEEFKADRPFLMAVRHNKTSAILFSGCLMTP